MLFFLLKGCRCAQLLSRPTPCGRQAAGMRCRALTVAGPLSLQGFTSSPSSPVPRRTC